MRVAVGTVDELPASSSRGEEKVRTEPERKGRTKRARDGPGDRHCSRFDGPAKRVECALFEIQVRELTRFARVGDDSAAKRNGKSQRRARDDLENGEHT